jgi:hypothetical protein
VYYVQDGRVRLSVVSEQGKEATIALLGPGDFLGEGCIAFDQPVHMATATASTRCTVLKIEKQEMLSTLQTSAPTASSPAKSIGMYAYPKNQQNADQQLKEENEFFASAKQQSGIDPPGSAARHQDRGAKESRATGSCGQCQAGKRGSCKGRCQGRRWRRRNWSDC